MKSYQRIVLLALTGLLVSSFNIDNAQDKRLKKEIQKVLEIDSFQLIPMSISDGLKEELPTKVSPLNFYRIQNGNDFLGYVFKDQAASKTAKFDYMVVFNPELKIIHTKVLVYREEYGGEIGSKRWLKQFIGKTTGDRVDHETNIDGIAGATISVRSMTNAIDDLLQTMTILKSKNKL